MISEGVGRLARFWHGTGSFGNGTFNRGGVSSSQSTPELVDLNGRSLGRTRVIDYCVGLLAFGVQRFLGRLAAGKFFRGPTSRHRASLAQRRSASTNSDFIAKLVPTRLSNSSGTSSTIAGAVACSAAWAILLEH